MELSKEHIKHLYQFTKQHKVEHYDLQTELVDHLANDIEQIWAKNPNLTFEQARYKATIKFGLKGFSKFVQQREKALKKENWRLFKRFFIGFFKLPKIVLTFLLALLAYLALDLSTNKTSTLFIILSIINAIAFLYAILILLKYRIRRKKTGKKWLFESITQGSTFFVTFVVLFQPHQFYQLLHNNISISWTFITQTLWSFGISVFVIFFYIALWVIPRKFEATIKNYKVA